MHAWSTELARSWPLQAKGHQEGTATRLGLQGLASAAVRQQLPRPGLVVTHGPGPLVPRVPSLQQRTPP